MAWEKGQYGGVSTVTIPSNIEWIPDLAIANAVDKLTILNEIVIRIMCVMATR